MSAAQIPGLVSIADLERLPEPASGHYELHHGEVVLRTPPLHSHKLLQRRLRVLLEDIADACGYVVDTEYAYRPLPESELWVADVACVSVAREQAIVKWLEGSPDLAIEVKSPGNTKEELREKAMTTLAGESSVEFWIVDPETETLAVYSRISGVHVYGSEMTVPVHFSAESIPLSRIFAPRFR